VARIERQRSNELALRSAIAFTKRVDGIKFAEIVASPVRERVGVQSSEPLLRRKRGEEAFQRRNQKLRRRKSKRIRTRRNDFPEVACPRKDVLKNILMDSAQVLNVEFAFERIRESSSTRVADREAILRSNSRASRSPNVLRRMPLVSSNCESKTMTATR